MTPDEVTELQQKLDDTLKCLDNLFSWASTCRVHNTSEWMTELAARLDAVIHTKDSTSRMVFNGDYIAIQKKDEML